MAGIGGPEETGQILITGSQGEIICDQQAALNDISAAAHRLVQWLKESGMLGRVRAVGHRIVHGGVSYQNATVATSQVIKDLSRLVDRDPVHLPAEIKTVELFRDLLGRSVVHILCFDTAFHRTIPVASRTYGLPLSVRRLGVQRFGFHGLSYQYVSQRLGELDRDATERKTVVAHLGSGASLCAMVRYGETARSIDTTMGFTPAGGLVMGQRSGDLDPGVLVYLARTLGMDAHEMRRAVEFEGGLKGISQKTGDMKILLEGEAAGDKQCTLAIAVFCHHARRWIGAMAASLDGIDDLVFTGGIGEKSAVVRQRVMTGLGYLGLHMIEPRNKQVREGLISSEISPKRVWVIPTNEQIVIAEAVQRVLEKGDQDDSTSESKRTIQAAIENSD